MADLKKFQDPFCKLGIFTMGVDATDGLAYVPDAAGTLTLAGATDYYRVHLLVAAKSGDGVTGVLTGAVIAKSVGALAMGQPCKPAANGLYDVATVGTDHVSGYAGTVTSGSELFTLVKVA